MRHLIKNSILVVLSYSMAFSTPVVAQSNPEKGFKEIKDYVNSSSNKKNYRDLLALMENDLPVTFYEDAIKKTRGNKGKEWFQAAKMASNYLYLRVDDAKIFIRITEEKDKTVFYANGLRIHQDDFRNMKFVENKLILAAVAGLTPKKVSFFDVFKINSSFAGIQPQEAANSNLPKGGLAPVVPQGNDDQCEKAAKHIVTALQQGDQASANQMCSTKNAEQCNFPLGTCKNIPVAAAKASSGKSFMNETNWVLLGSALLLAFFLLRKNRDKKKKIPVAVPTPLPTPTPTPVAEVPENTNGVGRLTGINCGGEGAQCTPGQPVAPPTGVNVYDPNFFKEASAGTGRVGEPAVPAFKLKKK